MANIANSFRLSVLASEGSNKSAKVAQLSISKSIFSVEKISKAIRSNTNLKENLERK